MALRDFYNPSVITDGFGVPRGDTTHTGVDFAFPEGTPIPALLPGTVRTNAYDDRYGNYLDISTPNGGVVRYGHMRAKANPPVGAKVNIGDIIGYVGFTGYADGPHLHLEIRNSDGTFTDPTPTVTQLINMPQSAIDLLNKDTSGGPIDSLLGVGGTIIDGAGKIVGTAVSAVNVFGDVAGYAADLIKWILTERHWWAIAFGAGGLAMMGVGVSIYFNKEIQAGGTQAATVAVTKGLVK